VLSIASAGCLLWLDALRPFFAVAAVAALGWQAWLVGRRPAARRTSTMWAILVGTVGVNALVALTWASWWWRYR
jgi:hypothetical protein